MNDNANDEGQDVFDDAPDGGSSAHASEMSFTTKDNGEQFTDDENQGQEENGETGDKDAAPPAADQEDDLEAVTDAKGQKMIPEHRFKAALKKVTDELEQTNSKLKEYETPKVEVPDKDIDPEGHDLHIRMEASTQVCREMYPDYQDVINHYATMAEGNDLLNQAVSKHPIPAKLAYDIAKKDLKIKEALATIDSDEWKEFQEYKKSKGEGKTKTAEETTLNTTINRGLKAVPNLNRTTNASPNRNVRQNSNGDHDDDLFKGAL